MTISSVQSLSRVRLFATPWTAARQASLFITNSKSLLKLMSLESVMPSNHLILCCPLLLPPSIFPSIRVFSNESVLPSGGQNIGVSASVSVLPMNMQDWSPLGWTGWISLLSKGFSRVFSNTTVQSVWIRTATMTSAIWLTEEYATNDLRFVWRRQIELVIIMPQRDNIMKGYVNPSALSFLYSLALTSIHDYWKNHSFD